MAWTAADISSGRRESSGCWNSVARRPWGWRGKAASGATEDPGRTPPEPPLVGAPGALTGVITAGRRGRGDAVARRPVRPGARNCGQTPHLRRRWRSGPLRPRGRWWAGESVPGGRRDEEARHPRQAHLRGHRSRATVARRARSRWPTKPSRSERCSATSSKNAAETAQRCREPRETARTPAPCTVLPAASCARAGGRQEPHAGACAPSATHTRAGSITACAARPARRGGGRSSSRPSQDPTAP